MPTRMTRIIHGPETPTSATTGIEPTPQRSTRGWPRGRWGSARRQWKARRPGRRVLWSTDDPGPTRTGPAAGRIVPVSWSRRTTKGPGIRGPATLQAGADQPQPVLLPQLEHV